MATTPAQFTHESLLSESERALWLGFVGAHAAIVRRLDEQLRAGAGLPLASFEVLYELVCAPENRLRMADLAGRLRFTRSGLTRLVERLEQLGYVERRDCDVDRRGVYALLTRSGFETFEAAAPGHVDTVRRVFFDHVPDDAEPLRDLLELLTLESD